MSKAIQETEDWAKDIVGKTRERRERDQRRVKEAIQKISKDIEEIEANVSRLSLDLWGSYFQNQPVEAYLDDQPPETLYYLAQMTEIPEVKEVYVEHRDNGTVKHWAVLAERDFEAMDEVYEVELDVRERFPGADLRFRVTVAPDSGPSVAPKAQKIYTRQ